MNILTKFKIKEDFQFWCNIYWNLWTILLWEKSLNLVTNRKVINYKATGRSHLFVILQIFVPDPCINLNVLHNWLPSLTGNGHKSEMWHLCPTKILNNSKRNKLSMVILLLLMWFKGYGINNCKKEYVFFLPNKLCEKSDSSSNMF